MLTVIETCNLFNETLTFKLQLYRQALVTWFLKDMGSMGSSAAKEIDDSRMKRRMMLVKVVALIMRWQSLRNLKWLRDIFMSVL